MSTTTCRICGDEFRDGDDVVRLGDDDIVHHDCADPPHHDEERHVEQWGEMGAINQLEIGEVQRGE